MDAPVKNPRRRWAVGLLIALNLLTLAALWLTVVRRPSWGPRPGDRGNPEEFQNFLRRELGLSDAQAAEFDRIRDRFVEAARPTHDEIRKLKEQILAEMLKTEPDRILLEGLTARIGVLRGEEEKLLTFHFLDLMASLKPEQKPKFLSILREFMTRIGVLEPAGPPDRTSGGKGRPEAPPHGTRPR